MKKLQLVLLFVFSVVLLRAQDGVFLTYEDFKNNKVVPADEKSLNYNFGTKGYVSLKEGGVKKKWKLEEVYGFRSDTLCWRALHCPDCKDGAAVIILTGNFVHYMTTIEVPHSSGNTGYKYHYFISKDLTSDVYEFTAHLETLDALLDAHKEFAALKPYLDKAKKGARSEWLVEDCIKKSAEYKTAAPLPKSKK